MMRFNLLPQKYQSHFKDEIMARIFYTVTLFILTWMVVLGILVFASFQFLLVQNALVAERIAGAQSVREIAEAEEFEEKIVELNRLLLRVEEIKNTEGYDAGFLLGHLAPMVPAGSNLKKFTYSTSGNKLFLEGRADLRTQVITLQNRLESDPLFVKVDYPFSNLLKAENVDFSFTLTLAEK
ncbi:MAG: hypothetical protein WD712_02910 [Candidatus Spechtbacterales bacterium]